MTTTNATSGTTQTGQTEQTITNPAATLGKDDFLKLLVAQLKYQDPLKPSDQSQMMSQMAQFSMVEGINNLQASITSLGTTSSVSQAVGLIGKELTFLQDDGTNGTGTASSVSLVDGVVTVHVGNKDVALSDVLKVSDVSNPTSTQAAGA
jgi:flagellar basal-body rod modification protein FlgD